MNVKYMYKIHSLKVANGVSRSAGNDTFYETEEAALQRAQDCVSNSVDNRTGMVVYQAIFVVRRIAAPVEVIPIDRLLI